jgi:hypothetical protein
MISDTFGLALQARQTSEAYLHRREATLLKLSNKTEDASRSMLVDQRVQMHT